MDNNQILHASRALTLVSYFSLLILLLINPLMQGAPFVFYLWLIPLAIFIPGVLYGHSRSLLWLCFVVLLYFYVAVDNVAGPAPSLLDQAELLATIVLFATCCIWLRCKQNYCPSLDQSE